MSVVPMKPATTSTTVNVTIRRSRQTEMIRGAFAYPGFSLGINRGRHRHRYIAHRGRASSPLPTQPRLRSAFTCRTETGGDYFAVIAPADTTGRIAASAMAAPNSLAKQP
jgi:hypothetical protein